ncbi:MAG: RNA polymerase sigma factor [Planctomycetia bacterium]
MAEPHDEDADWMRRVAADEPRAFETLVARTLPRLLGFLRRLGADPASAEDLAQEVYLKVYRARAAWQPRARFTTYLFHLARNQFIDAYRQRRSAPPSVSADAARPGPAGGEDAGASLASTLPGREAGPGEGLAAGELQAALAEVLEGLDPLPREAFVLAHVCALPYDQIAEVLGVPVGTVKSRVHHATQAVREGLRRRGLEP